VPAFPTACAPRASLHRSSAFLRLATVLLYLRIMSKNTSSQEQGLQKDPDDWKTGDEPMTPAQRSYLETLARDNGEAFDENLTKAEASKRIDELRKESPRVSSE
jgi:hypothetical protein